MSTAVLAGAQLSEWISSSEQDYLEKAIRAASQKRHLRISRDRLRQHVQESQLHDVKGLSVSLWSSFAEMAHTRS